MSSHCVVIDSNGFVVSTATPADSCSHYVLLDSADYAGSSVWRVPDAAHLTEIWTFAFVAPVVIYLLCFSLGSVLSFFRRS